MVSLLVEDVVGRQMCVGWSSGKCDGRCCGRVTVASWLMGSVAGRQREVCWWYH